MKQGCVQEFLQDKRSDEIWMEFIFIFLTVREMQFSTEGHKHVIYDG